MPLCVQWVETGSGTPTPSRDPSEFFASWSVIGHTPDGLLMEARMQPDIDEDNDVRAAVEKVWLPVPGSITEPRFVRKAKT
jgi:hypothetical protein